MYNKFIRECPTRIVGYLQYKNKININPWGYISYLMHEGTLNHIAIIDFIHITRSNSSFIIDLREYFDYYRRLKINKLKKLI